MTKILVVDDSSMARRVLRAILEQAGYQVIEAADGVTAIEQYFVERPTLVMLDLLMTGMAGTEVLEQLLKLDPTACIIIATADIQDLTRATVAASGAKGFISKPFSVSAVLGVVHSVLESVVQ